MKKSLRIGLIGAGAVGSFYAAHLAKSGADVTLLTRHPAEYSTPIKIQSIHGAFEFKPTAVHFLTDACGPFDALVLATKVLPDIDFVKLIKPFMASDTILLMIQNGIFIESPILKEFSQPVLRCLAFICAHRMNRTLIDHLDYGALVLGPLNCDFTLLEGHPLIQLLKATPLSITFSNSIQQAIWEKLIWNASFNPISVLFDGQTTAELLSNDHSKQLILDVMHEVQMAASIANVHITDEFIDKNIDQTSRMAPYKTSMCLDYEAKRPLEIEAILGNLLRYAAAHSMELPNVRSIYQQLIDF